MDLPSAAAAAATSPVRETWFEFKLPKERRLPILLPIAPFSFIKHTGLIYRSSKGLKICVPLAFELDNKMNGAYNFEIWVAQHGM